MSSPVGGSQAGFSPVMVGHNCCGCRELFWKDLSMRSTQCFVHIGCNECILSNCSDSQENHSHREDLLRGHLEWSRSGQRAVSSLLASGVENFHQQDGPCDPWQVLSLGALFAVI